MNRSRSKTATNIVAISFGGLGIHLINFGFAIVAAHWLSISDFGTYSYLSTLYVILSMAADLGITVFTVKCVAQSPGSSGGLAVRLILIRAVTMMASFMAAAGLLSVRSTDPTAAWYLALMGAGSALSSVTVVAAAWFRGLQRMGMEAGLRLSATLLAAGGSIAALLTGGGIRGIALGHLMGQAVALLICLVYNPWKKSAGTLEGPSNHPSVLGILRQALPFATLGILVTISYRIDSVLLEYFRGSREVAIYAAAYRILEGAVLMRGVLPSVLLPILSGVFAAGNTGDLPRLTRPPMKFHVVGGICCALALGLGAPLWVRLFYGASRYAESAPSLEILGVASAAMWMSSVTSVIISAGPRPQVNTAIAFMMVLINVGVNCAVLPRWGAPGAAVATIVTEWFGLLSGLLYIRKALFRAGLGLEFWVGLLASLVLFPLSLRFPSPLWLLGGPGIYFLILLVGRIVTPQEIGYYCSSIVGRKASQEPPA
jgi:O-antigen/teichoic acid export membrane protein